MGKTSSLYLLILLSRYQCDRFIDVDYRWIGYCYCFDWVRFRLGFGRGGRAILIIFSFFFSMPVVAACFLIPFSVVVYVLVGGMRATLISDYTHTAVLYAIILTFMGVVFGTSSQIGSPKKLYDLLVLAGERSPIAGNAGGSYLTLSSKSGAIFGVINLVGNFATV